MKAKTVLSLGLGVASAILWSIIFAIVLDAFAAIPLGIFFGVLTGGLPMLFEKQE